MRDWILVLPEITLALTLSGLIACEIAYRGERVRLVSMIALFGLAAAFFQTIVAQRYAGAVTAAGALAVDGLSGYFRLFFIALAFLVSSMTVFTREISGRQRTEYFAFVTAAALAMCLAASAADFMVVFLSLQFVNLIGYFMAGYSKDRAVSTEAAVKFMVFGAVSSVVLLYAVAVLFSVSGTLDIYSIPSSVGAQPAAYRSSLLIMVLLFLSLSFYLGMFPMHLWMPDVMQGVPLPTAAFLSLGLPAVGFSVLLRLLLVVFSAKGTEGHVAWPFYGEGGWSEVLALASGTTMLAGALVAMRQASAKRMMAGLVASHLGLLLMGALVLNADGISAVVFNLTAQLFALVGVFCSLSFLYDRLGTDRLEHFRGVLYRAIPECVCLILFLACFVGFPPFPGFLGRFLLIGAAVHEHWYVLAIVATISTVVSIAAFLRLATSLAGPIPDGRVRGFAAASGTAAATATGQRAFLTLLLLPLIFLTLFAHSALQWVHQALQFQLW